MRKGSDAVADAPTSSKGKGQVQKGQLPSLRSVVLACSSSRPSTDALSVKGKPRFARCFAPLTLSLGIGASHGRSDLAVRGGADEQEGQEMVKRADGEGGDVVVEVHDDHVCVDFVAHGYFVVFEPEQARAFAELLTRASFRCVRAPANRASQGREAQRRRRLHS